MNWAIETDSKYDHASQIGVILTPDGRANLHRFCECQAGGLLGNKKLYELTHSTFGINGRQFFMVFTENETMNRFGQGLSGLPVTGPALIFIRDEDLGNEEIDLFNRVINSKM